MQILNEKWPWSVQALGTFPTAANHFKICSKLKSFASRLALTEVSDVNVMLGLTSNPMGAGLPAKRPAQTPQPSKFVDMPIIRLARRRQFRGPP